ncbi:MAG: helix-turn-helix transcriptional regulator, partial [Candidatus Helarchaeota archaeon]|nr:helix-turn-helix transcriptional regulator [Candidatus Helarchaeota archaeon]
MNLELYKIEEELFQKFANLLFPQKINTNKLLNVLENSVKNLQCLKCKLIYLLKRDTYKISNIINIPLNEMLDIKQLFEKIEAAKSVRNLQKVLPQVINDLREAVNRVINNSNEIALKAKCIIDLNYRQNLSLQDVAGQLHICKDHLNRKFKKQYGYTINSYIINVRLKNALELLTFSNLSAKQVCYQVGFQTYRNFIYHFKKRHKILPKEIK